MTTVHEQYHKIEHHEFVLPACACCGSPAELWEHQASEAAAARKVVMCSNLGAGPEGDTNKGHNADCPLAMPPEQYYCATKKQAVEVWTKWRAPPASAVAELLERIDRKAEAGLCAGTFGGAREYLKDIRAIAGVKKFDPDLLPPRDEYGFTSHPDMPEWGENEDGTPLLAALGYESAFVSMESESEELSEAYCEGDNTACAKWTPTSPGPAWRLAAIYDTEDGPCALFLRPMARPA